MRICNLLLNFMQYLIVYSLVYLLSCVLCVFIDLFESILFHISVIHTFHLFRMLCSYHREELDLQLIAVKETAIRKVCIYTDECNM